MLNSLLMGWLRGLVLAGGACLFLVGGLALENGQWGAWPGVALGVLMVAAGLRGSRWH